MFHSEPQKIRIHSCFGSLHSTERQILCFPPHRHKGQFTKNGVSYNDLNPTAVKCATCINHFGVFFDCPCARKASLCQFVAQVMVDLSSSPPAKPHPPSALLLSEAHSGKKLALFAHVTCFKICYFLCQKTGAKQWIHFPHNWRSCPE